MSSLTSQKLDDEFKIQEGEARNVCAQTVVYNFQLLKGVGVLQKRSHREEESGRELGLTSQNNLYYFPKKIILCILYLGMMETRFCTVQIIPVYYMFKSKNYYVL